MCLLSERPQKKTNLSSDVGNNRKRRDRSKTSKVRFNLPFSPVLNPKRDERTSFYRAHNAAPCFVIRYSV